jgi:O-acetyl-ADP-ribose deacetylase (regulator of RNase III)
MIGQHGLRNAGGEPPIRYDAVGKCLAKVAAKAKELGASVHMPRIGCGLAGGRWEVIEPLIVQSLCEQDVSAVVYDF